MAQDTQPPPTIKIDNENLEVVDSFTYLGSKVSNTLSIEEEINSRIGKAAATMAKLNKRVWQNTKLINRENQTVCL